MAARAWTKPQPGLLFEHESLAALARLSDDELRSYQDEQRELAGSDMSVPE